MNKNKFIIWEQDTFGFSYGIGEPYVLRSLKYFLELCPNKESYNYKTLEERLRPEVAWLLINILCRKNILDYGTSPRFGWLSDKGIELKIFIEKHTINELCEMLNITEEEEFRIRKEESDGKEEGINV